MPRPVLADHAQRKSGACAPRALRGRRSARTRRRSSAGGRGSRGTARGRSRERCRRRSAPAARYRRRRRAGVASPSAARRTREVRVPERDGLGEDLLAALVDADEHDVVRDRARPSVAKDLHLHVERRRARAARAAVSSPGHAARDDEQERDQHVQHDAARAGLAPQPQRERGEGARRRGLVGAECAGCRHGWRSSRQGRPTT